MPIFSLSGAEAVRLRKDNPFTNWGSRNEPNRVEPFTRPAFDVPFTFEPGEKIFTIGSCFARNVEDELIKRGFAVPLRDVFALPEFAGVGLEVVNNYGTPSIADELAWAFGEKRFDEESAFLELRPGQYYDLSLHFGLRPGPIEQVRARRAALTAAIATLAECRVVVMTLGLVELWWDEQARRYLNTIPLPSILANSPDRFALHVLSFEEAHEHLVQALDIAFRHGRPDLRVILTVSPVPLMATHRPADVIVANCYSKSVLRAAAEHVVMADERIVYYPSYESVTHSDRRLAWTDDFVHVTEDIVAFNVDRMVNAFTGRPERDDYRIRAGMEASEEPAGAIAMIEQARAARAAGDRAFFDTNASWSEKSPGFLLEHAGFLNERGEQAAALALLAKAEQPTARLMRAEIALAMGDAEGAIAAVRPLCSDKTSGQRQWRLLLEATGKAGDADAVIEVEAEWLRASPWAPETVAFHVARLLRRIGDNARAVPRFRAAQPHFARDNAFFAIECATAYLEAGLAHEAHEALAGAQGSTPWQRKRITQLREESAGVALSA